MTSVVLSTLFAPNEPDPEQSWRIDTTVRAKSSSIYTEGFEG
jgi:hypothetical protein